MAISGRPRPRNSSPIAARRLSRLRPWAQSRTGWINMVTLFLTHLVEVGCSQWSRKRPRGRLLAKCPAICPSSTRATACREESDEEGSRRSEKTRTPRLRWYPSLSCSVARQRGRGEIALIQRQSRSLLPCEFGASFSLPRQRQTGGWGEGGGSVVSFSFPFSLSFFFFSRATR